MNHIYLFNHIEPPPISFTTNCTRRQCIPSWNLFLLFQKRFEPCTDLTTVEVTGGVHLKTSICFLASTYNTAGKIDNPTRRSNNLCHLSHFSVRSLEASNHWRSYTASCCDVETHYGHSTTTVCTRIRNFLPGDATQQKTRERAPLKPAQEH